MRANYSRKLRFRVAQNVPGALAHPPITLAKKQKPTKWSVCVFGGSGWIRTTSVVRQQIYSLPRLSNSGARPELSTISGASSGNRTRISSLEGLHSSP